MTHSDSPADTGQLSPETLYEARGWLLDCGFSDELLFDLTDDQIVRFVDREYDGGWTAFLTDSTGRLVDRRLTTKPTSAGDAMAQWNLLIAKASVLSPPRDHTTPPPVSRTDR